MNPVAFTVKVPVAHLTWAAGTGRGGLLPATGSEVVLHPGATIELVVELGADGFALLTTLALLARPDDEGRLYVDGGVERLRTVLGWGEEKAGRVFREVAAAGFVTREQRKDPAARGRFLPTRLILDPALYAPAATAPGKPGTGERSPGGTAPGEPGSGQPGAGGTGVGSSAPGDAGAGARFPGRTGSEFTGPGQPRPMDELSDEEMGHGHLSAAVVEDAAPEPGARATLVAALELLAFTDAAAVLDRHPADLVERSVRYVVERLEHLDNPGGYLRRLVEQGGPPLAGPGLAARLSGLLGPAAPASEPPPPGPFPSPGGGAGSPPTEPAGPALDVAEVERRLAVLDEVTRTRIVAAADEAADLARQRAELRGMRLPKPAVAAARHQYLVEHLTADDSPGLDPPSQSPAASNQ